ncbi:MAG TPA: RNA polymerase sigma-54 factor, partial [Cyclobacteriaceae bacterium]|nr:RNA polymerase sigma-54 factor [Cyclobacteriaceae bacterium]
MQKLSLNQSLQQKLSPQQIQFIKLLQVPTAELESRIEEELELNPVLEEGSDEPEAEERTEEQPETPEAETSNEDLDIKDYLRDDDYNSYKTQSDGDGDDDDD